MRRVGRRVVVAAKWQRPVLIRVLVSRRSRDGDEHYRARVRGGGVNGQQ